jgi:hypothetical protein
MRCSLVKQAVVKDLVMDIQGYVEGWTRVISVLYHRSYSHCGLVILKVYVISSWRSLWLKGIQDSRLEYVILHKFSQWHRYFHLLNF